MINLLLSILFTTCLIISFKYFEKFKIETLQAIVVNYFTAATLGFLFSSGRVSITDIPQQSWAIMALVLGVSFISVFNLIAITTQKLGVSVATVANKMSLVIPVMMAIYLYHDSINLIKLTGIILAILAVYLTSKKEKIDANAKTDPNLFFLPIIVFIGSGIIDSMINYSQVRYLKQDDVDIFISTAFVFSGCSGVLILLYRRVFQKKSFQIKSLIGGICLGIPNYFSIYFLLKALDNKAIQSSVLFPLNNMGIVVLSAIYSLIFFKENLSGKNWLGLVLAVVAIIFIAIA